MNKNSPFQDWLDANTPGYAFSAEIRELLAKAYEGGYVDGNQSAVEAKVAKFIDAHTKPWVGLTHDEWQALYVHHHDTSGHTDSQWGYEFAIQAKLKEKNT